MIIDNVYLPKSKSNVQNITKDTNVTCTYRENNKKDSVSFKALGETYLLYQIGSTSYSAGKGIFNALKAADKVKIIDFANKVSEEPRDYTENILINTLVAAPKFDDINALFGLIQNSNSVSCICYNLASPKFQDCIKDISNPVGQEAKKDFFMMELLNNNRVYDTSHLSWKYYNDFIKEYPYKILYSPSHKIHLDKYNGEKALKGMVRDTLNGADKAFKLGYADFLNQHSRELLDGMKPHKEIKKDIEGLKISIGRYPVSERFQRERIHFLSSFLTVINGHTEETRRLANKFAPDSLIIKPW